jgi:succinoglycan biosynthesis protein ExoA
VPNTNLTDKPLVSVVLATFNESAHVRRCMESLLAQQTPNCFLEVLAIDGGSTDGTREYLDSVAAADAHVRVLPNPNRRAPFAFNIGIRECRGEYVCVFGSHTIYSRDYISVCLAELQAKGAAGCGGRVLTEPAASTLQARLVAYATAHPFGSSAKSFRTQPEGFAELVNYMILRKSALIEAGGYSEVLLRNQDNDLNQKLRANGHRLYCTWKTHCTYHPQPTLRGLFRYAYNCGFWNLLSFKANPASMSLYHFVPFFFVLALFASAPLSLFGLFSPHPWLRLLASAFPAFLFLHLAAGTLASLQVASRKRWLGALLLPFAFLGFHLSYGLGTLAALISGAAAAKSPVLATVSKSKLTDGFAA